MDSVGFVFRVRAYATQTRILTINPYPPNWMDEKLQRVKFALSS